VKAGVYIRLNKRRPSMLLIFSALWFIRGVKYRLHITQKKKKTPHPRKKEIIKKLRKKININHTVPFDTKKKIIERKKNNQMYYKEGGKKKLNHIMYILLVSKIEK